eukprot:1376137-Amorphochlora_amoeboformis.AAC.1
MKPLPSKKVPKKARVKLEKFEQTGGWDCQKYRDFRNSRCLEISGGRLKDTSKHYEAYCTPNYKGYPRTGGGEAGGHVCRGKDNRRDIFGKVLFEIIFSAAEKYLRKENFSFRVRHVV